VRGRPDLHFGGTITRRLRAGQETLPSAALGYLAGGQMAVSPDDPEGRRTAQRFFELIITPDPGAETSLLVGQRVIVRLEMDSKPYVLQWWRKFQRLVQKRLVL
jgi:putative peptide zinc metalloprotease protein